MGKHKELKYTELKNYCIPEELKFDDTDDLGALKGIIGQERAVEAFDFGIMVKMKGYNIYMSGPSGTGKTTYAKMKAKEVAKSEPVPDDWCYVYNFENPERPKALRFATGKGKEFKEDMGELVELFNSEIQKAFNSGDYEKQKNDITKVFEDKRESLMKDMSDMAKENGFSVKSTNSGIYFMPMIDGNTINEEEYEKLDEETKAQINEASEEVQEKAGAIMRDIRDIDKEMRKAISDLDYKVGMFAIGHHVSTVQEKYKDYDDVIKYINDVKEDVLENIDEFIGEDEEIDESLSALIPMLNKKQSEDITLKYSVNLFVDNSETKGAPVVIDFNPTYYNLIGEVEYGNEFGNLTTDFMKIKSGLLHKANGGYLIIQVQDLLSNVQSWEALRRVIKTKEVTIENLREQLGISAMPTLKPEPIPVDVKIILIGSSYYYEMLSEYDDDFGKFFKIRAEFDYEMVRNEENIHRLAKFIKAFSEREKTAPFDSSAVAKIVEYSSRLVERQDKLSTRFNYIAEILCESATWARIEKSDIITAYHVNKAISEKENRLKMYEEKLGDMMDESVIMIDTEGKKIGQINGLAVFDMGSYMFGNPSRITATTYLGKSGIINIEKEAEMSGQTHNKGVQIITGYLGQTYAQDFPLSLSCRICFEQNYNGIDGDSASSTELYCILSSLSEIPINQEIAVTGSINQRGEIQAIGGVTYKIEGFFDLCKKRGLTGTQGVMIPTTNVKDLVLRDDVIGAVKEGMFHIYPVSTLDEGIEILMDTPASKVHKKVKEKLELYYKKSIAE
ncbi:MAG: AAA family ATPase [Tyzzerella sp.]|uniref:endopeptidase La n=1 Tax=Candidatus Fimicola merdigallinarum TaxID=2840819 RepID=A0A9D9DXH9_9FIRM|nr:AAA family ATPase [Candidatus Fimicola merdigallinarum]